jgi:tetrahydromethanopterin S-methyltransferase subunit G
MRIFKAKKNEVAVSRIHSFLSVAFTKVKNDMMQVTNWLKYFHQKHQEHDQRLNEIEQQISYIPKTPNEIKQIIDSYYSYDHILNKVRELSQRLDNVEQRKPVIRHEPKQIIRERIVRKIARNSKDYVKSTIISLIKKYGKISAPQLKEMVIEEQGLCSKSSFYRILEELESDEEINTIKQGKEKVFFFKTAIIK